MHRGELAWRTPCWQRGAGHNVWIAATALAYGATLLGRDRTFHRVPKLAYLSF